MKKILIILFFTSYNFIVSPNCSDLKTGKFKVKSEENGTVFITRTQNKQIEENEDYRVKIRYKVKWIDDCTYQLYDAKILKGDNNVKRNRTDTLTVNINNVKAGSYQAFITSNYSDISISTEIEIVE